MSRPLLILASSLLLMLVMVENIEAVPGEKLCETCCGPPPCCSFCAPIVTKRPKLCLMCCGPPPCCNFCGLEPWFRKY
ncbi:hypothetical protein KUTeg_020236 [Tegillarca granosa]|uniref:Uncharacterized protein n=1 Tax=Tegillarca granosa TaxID=220873 RepID=A0ABQ9E789_TEGGR|nr:hypothetical protein KUTeg_020236 [Tegillarca granosa]